MLLAYCLLILAPAGDLTGTPVAIEPTRPALGTGPAGRGFPFPQFPSAAECRREQAAWEAEAKGHEARSWACWHARDHGTSWGWWENKLYCDRCAKLWQLAGWLQDGDGWEHCPGWCEQLYAEEIAEAVGEHAFVRGWLPRVGR